jgi:Tfp pilus assembly protein PilF
VVALSTLLLSFASAATARAQFGATTEKPTSGFKKFTSSVTSGFKKTFSKKDKKERPPLDEHDPLALANKPKHIDADFYVSLARLQEQAGATDAAIDQYKNALKENKQHLPAMMGLAHIYERKRQPEHALEMYERAAKSHPNEASVFNDMGLCYSHCGKLEDAIRAQQKAVSLQPGRKLYRNNLATSLVRAGRAPEALDQLLAVHRPPTAHYNIGYLLNELGDHGAARFHFQRALELDPTFAPAQQWLAVLTPLATTPQQVPPLAGYGQPAPVPQLAVAPAQSRDERVAARPVQPSSLAAPSAGGPPPAAPRKPAPRRGAPVAPPSQSYSTANQRSLVPPTQPDGERDQQALPRVVGANPVVVPHEDSHEPDESSPAERPQWSQTPGGFVQIPAVAGTDSALTAEQQPAMIGSHRSARVAARPASAALIQNPAALDEANTPADAPLPTSTTKRSMEYRAPSRY